jgi:hypothetical protein
MKGKRLGMDIWMWRYGEMEKESRVEVVMYTRTWTNEFFLKI